MLAGMGKSMREIWPVFSQVEGVAVKAETLMDLCGVDLNAKRMIYVRTRCEHAMWRKERALIRPWWWSASTRGTASNLRAREDKRKTIVLKLPSHSMYGG